jgi:hypothetical protein
MAIRKTQEEFIKQSKRIFGDLLDYSLVEYKNRRTKVTLVCKYHGLLNSNQYYLVKSKPDYLCKICIQNKHIKFRTEVLSAYSPSLECALCGENNLEFLALDHCNGGGVRDMKNHGGQCSLWYALKRHEYPDGYRVLCHNCNHTQRIVNIYRSESNNRDRVKIKSEVIGYYGGGCECCETDDFEVLCIDHINGGGRAQAREIKLQGSNFNYYWLKRNGFPAGYRVLCYNCNMAKGFYGTCPHEGVV